MKCYQMDLRMVLNQWPVLAKVAGIPEIGGGQYAHIVFDTAIVSTSWILDKILTGCMITLQLCQSIGERNKVQLH